MAHNSELVNGSDNLTDIFALSTEWHVLHTKSRQEKVLSADLAAMGVSSFLPLVSSVRHYGRRQQKVELPLFSGYLFLRGSLDDVYRADRTGRIAQVIRVPDQQKLDWELRNLALALESGCSLDPYPYLQKGVLVEVKSGPLRGLQGVIESRSSGNRIIFQIQMLGRAVSMEIDAALLDVV